MQETKFISAVILLSPNPQALATFYKDGLGIPLDVDQHQGEAPPHYECELGDLHFAIHPLEGPASPLSTQRIKFAFAVADLTATLERLRTAGTEPIYPPIDRGFARITAIRDSDGNLVELTQLSESWLRHLNSRSKSLRDIVEGLGRS